MPVELPVLSPSLFLCATQRKNCFDLACYRRVVVRGPDIGRVLSHHALSNRAPGVKAPRDNA
eukprot:2855198-Amphidinium_carterae.1